MKKHVCIINRWSVGWDSEKPSYGNVLDHDVYQVSYIVDAEGRKGLTEQILSTSIVEMVEDIGSLDEIRAAFDRIEERGGKVFRLFALSEWDLLTAGQLRDEKKLEGLTYEQALNARDKVRMKEIVSAAHLRTPSFSKCDSVEELDAFVAQTGFPIVIKPRRMAASRGVYIIHDECEYVEALRELEFDDLECEEFCSGTVFHIDGLVQNGELVFCIPFRYLEQPINFLKQCPLGSLSIEQTSPLHQKLVTFAQQVVNALGINNTMFHLEVILDETQADSTPVFMEIGARMSGADIPRCVSMLIGRDAVAEQLRVEMGKEVSAIEIDKEVSVGCLLIPFPKELPCIMVKNKSFQNVLPSLVEEFLRREGDVLDGTGGYLKIPARFIFKGTPEQVMRDMKTVMSEHVYETKLPAESVK